MFYVRLYLNFLFNCNFNDGIKKRFGQILNNIDSEDDIFYALKNKDGNICLGHFYCASNEKSDKKVFLLGDSHMAAISYDLNNKLIEKDYQFIPLTIPSCYFFRDFDKIDIRTNKKISKCSASEIEKRYNLIKENSKSIIIIGGRLSYQLSGINYQDFLGNKNVEFKYKSSSFDNVKESFIKNILDFSKENNVILIYPYPEMNVDISKKIQHGFFLEKKKMSEFLNSNTYFEPFENYLNRSKDAFNLLDSVENENIYRVYPHLIVCQNLVKDFCVTHDNTEIFYSDKHHPSTKASEMINDLIIKEIEKIELKLN